MSRHIEGIKHLNKEHAVYHKADCDGERDTRVLIFSKNNNTYTTVLEKDRIVDIKKEVYYPLSTGAVVKAKVTNVLKNMGGAFARLDAKDTMAYLPITQAVLEKIRITNRKADGRILQNDEVIVQVVKEAQKGKPIQVSGLIELVGMYYVLKDGKESIPRTNLQFADSNASNQEMIDLRSQFVDIDSYGQSKALYSILVPAKPVYKQVLTNLYLSRILEIVVEDTSIYNEISAMHYPAPIRKYEDPAFPLIKLYSLDTKIHELLSKKAFLKSGAYLVIEQTESLVSVDVNSGKAEKKTDPDEFAFHINMEAAKELFYQLRARNLSGMILVDFINMKNPDHKKELTDFLKQESRKDRIGCVFMDFTKLGLAEITRKKLNKPLSECLRDW